MKIPLKTAMRLTLLAMAFFCIAPNVAVPAEFNDRFGHQLTPKTPIKRVVSLAPSLTELLFQLELDSMLVGVTSYCDYPKRAQAIERVGGILDFDLEKILMLKPDVVLTLAQGSTQRQVRALEKALPGKVLTFEANNLDDLYQQLNDFGDLFSIEARAAAEMSRLRRRIDAVKRNAQHLPRVKALFIVGCQPIIGVANHNFVHEWLTIAGAKNVLEHKRGYPKLDPEWLVQYQPAVVLASIGKEEKSCPSLDRQVASLLDKKVIYLNANLFQRPGPRAAEAVEKIFALLRDNTTKATH